MQTFLWSLAILLAIGAGIVGIVIAFRLLKLILNAVLSVLGFVIGSFFELLISTLVDIRFISLFAVIFTIMAHYERGYWLWLSFVLTCTLFVLSASFIIIFVIDAFSRGFFLSFTSERGEHEFWDSIKKTIFLNVGFLGIFYILLAFSTASYSYFLLSSYTHDVPWVFAGPAGVTFSDFLSYTGQTAMEAIPFGIVRKFGINIANIDIRNDAFTFKAFVLVFQILIYLGIIGFVGAVRKLRQAPQI